MTSGCTSASATALTAPDDDWHSSLSAAIRQPHVLLERLGLDASITISAEALQDFALLVPTSYVDRMRVGDPHDALLRQVLPLDEEMQPVPGFSLDPVADAEARRTTGLLQKYSGRGLLIASATRPPMG